MEKLHTICTGNLWGAFQHGIRTTKDQGFKESTHLRFSFETSTGALLLLPLPLLTKYNAPGKIFFLALHFCSADEIYKISTQLPNSINSSFHLIHLYNPPIHSVNKFPLLFTSTVHSQVLAQLKKSLHSNHPFNIF